TMRDRHPAWNMIPRKVILGATTFGPIGQLKAPGTWGSVVGVLLFTLVFAYLAPLPYLLLNLCLIFLAVPLCEEAEIRLGRRDPGCVILDECVAIPVCFFAIPFQPGEPAWAWILGGFALFRFFDILKPLGISQLQKLQGGWGVVADDVAAAVATNIVLQIVYWLVI
ncbi:MAG: phosphatidylglycerophosphatase A family protein, partial [Puniceicoccales bacterium]